MLFFLFHNEMNEPQQQQPKILAPESPIINDTFIEKPPRQYPNKAQMHFCGWCEIPLNGENERQDTVGRSWQCFICGITSCAECIEQGKGCTLVNIGRRYICDTCTRDLVSHVENYSSEPIKRMKQHKRRARTFAAKGKLMTVKNCILD